MDDPSFRLFVHSVSLERDVMVEGCDVKGRMEVKVREWNKKEGDVYVGGGKVRIVGFEGKASQPGWNFCLAYRVLDT